jgi:hypothetical protein
LYSADSAHDDSFQMMQINDDAYDPVASFGPTAGTEEPYCPSPQEDGAFAREVSPKAEPAPAPTGIPARRSGRNAGRAGNPSGFATNYMRIRVISNGVVAFPC